jgi:hypothetical protein
LVFETLPRKLKPELSTAMRRFEIRQKLKHEFREYKSWSSLTRNARELISGVLGEVMTRLNASQDFCRGVRKAFQQTLLPGFPRHKELTMLLELGADLPPADFVQKPVVCKWGCGQRFTTVASRAYRDHGKHCWFCRVELLAPVAVRSEVTLNLLETSEPEWVVAEASMETGDNVTSRVLVGHAVSWNMETWTKLHTNVHTFENFN